MTMKSSQYTKLMKAMSLMLDEATFSPPKLKTAPPAPTKEKDPDDDGGKEPPKDWHCDQCKNPSHELGLQIEHKKLKDKQDEEDKKRKERGQDKLSHGHNVCSAGVTNCSICPSSCSPGNTSDCKICGGGSRGGRGSGVQDESKQSLELNVDGIAVCKKCGTEWPACKVNGKVQNPDGCSKCGTKTPPKFKPVSPKKTGVVDEGEVVPIKKKKRCIGANCGNKVSPMRLSCDDCVKKLLKVPEKK